MSGRDPFLLPEEYLEIRGARVHNLKNIDLRIPHNKLVVVTGVSGSGKSSLVFDTIYNEGRRRYVESLSAYARQFLERMVKPDVEMIDGIAPTVAIRQKNTTRNPRSTVATSTEIYDFLRLLFARVGHTYCPECNKRVLRDDVDKITSQMLAFKKGSRWLAMFPVEAAAKYLSSGNLKERLFDIRERGYNRLYQAGQIFEFSTPESLLDIDFKKTLFVLVDRIVISPEMRERIADAVDIAYRECGQIFFENTDDLGKSLWFSEKFECRDCNLEFPDLEPRLFSFNSPVGACTRCEGFGETFDYNMGLIIREPQLTLNEGAVYPWESPAYFRYKTSMRKAAMDKGVDLDTAYRELPLEHRHWIEEGGKGFGGVRGYLEKLEKKRYKPGVSTRLSRWKEMVHCSLCNGTRLRQEALNVQVGGQMIAGIMDYSLAEALKFFKELNLKGAEKVIANSLLIEIKDRLKFLNEVGLQYLTLGRASATLSGGEAQRIQLATSLGSRLVGVCYVLDEPSIGLHSRDTSRLIGILKKLRDLGNTILVVEHDPEIMRAADYLVDLGPYSGELGGEVIFQGTYKKIVSQSSSLTGRYLTGVEKIPVPVNRRTPIAPKFLQFQGARKHNLLDVNFEIPLGILTVITGVSGSGKSTLVHEIVHKALSTAIQFRPKVFQDLYATAEPYQRPYQKMSGDKYLDDVVLVDQSPIERSSRSITATYIDVFTPIRELFSSTKLAKQRNYLAGFFSFNIPGGRCDTCDGTGKQTIAMQFLADVDLPCEDCDGKRYQSKMLSIKFLGKNICEVLDMTVNESFVFFAAHKKITNRLMCLIEVGLGYLRLGQPMSHLSGGEAQRMKLASHISEARLSNTLFSFDEPTTGLHFDDIARLMQVFNKLIDKGATVLVIEHNLDVIKCADWIIDLGPEGGDAGGQILEQGPPEAVAKSKVSHTAKYLQQVLA